MLCLSNRPSPPETVVRDIPPSTTPMPPDPDPETESTRSDETEFSERPSTPFLDIPSNETLPKPPKFNEIQKGFLERFLYDYLALDDQAKGAKKAWVHRTVLPEYCRQFDTKGFSIESLAKVYSF